MHKSILVFGLSALFCAQLALGQRISGTIYDAETTEALPGATFFIPSLSTGTVSDSNGKYSLSITSTGTYRVVFQFIGYQSESRTIDIGAEAIVLDIFLRPSTLETAPITVTARAAASDVLSTPQPVNVLEGVALQRSAGIAALEALDRIQGVRLVKLGSGVAKPVIRGLSGQRILIVEDGVRQEGQQWGNDHGPELDGFSIQRIEVVKGPSSLLYGSDAMGGVIQTSGQDVFGATELVSGKIGTSVSDNPRYLGLNSLVFGRKNDVVYAVTLGRQMADSYSSVDDFIPNSGLKEWNGSVTLGLDRDDFKVLLKGSRYRSDLGLFDPEFVEEHDEPATPDLEAHVELDPSKIAEPFQRVSHDKINLLLTKKWKGNRVAIQTAWQQNVRKEFEHHDDEPEAIPGADVLDDDHEGETPALHLQLSTLTTDVRLYHKPFGRLYGSVGVSFFNQSNKTLGEEFLIPSATTSNIGVYLTEEMLFPTFTVSGGIRADRRQLKADADNVLLTTNTEQTYTALSGALGISWHPDTDYSFSANLGRAWRAPVLIELYGKGAHHGAIRFEQGNPDLGIEKSLSIDGLFRWITPHVLFEASVYANRIDNFVHLQNTGNIEAESGLPIFDYSGAAAVLTGGEFSFEWHPHPLDWIHFVVAGDLIRGTNTDLDEALPMLPADRIQIELGFSQPKMGSFSDVEWSVGPTKVMRQSRVARNETTSNGYWLVETSLAGDLDLFSHSIQSMIQVRNLFDTKYTDHLSVLKPFGLADQGRSVTIQLTASF